MQGADYFDIGKPIFDPMISTHGWFILSDRLTVDSISEKTLWKLAV